MQEETKASETDHVDEQSTEDEETVEVIEPEIIDESEDTSEESEELKKAIEEKDEYYNHMLRLQAEYDNFKKRTQKERIAERKYKAQDLATELLPVLDNFERALQVEETEETKGLIQGITMVYNQFKEAFTSQGVKEVETVGATFDPNLHHAVMQVEEEGKDKDEVVEELQKGYILNDRVIRPAMVKVNK
ncbi:MAG TPA: nucleotide exchange factor GrpE [Bacillota bacterium]|nr:nucleotide exchange factor GrpE [Bacillota bacterium]